MSDDALIEAMARAIFSIVVKEAEFVPPNDDWKMCLEDAKAALAVCRPIIEAQERERCARVAEEYFLYPEDYKGIAAAIRSDGDE